MPPVSVKRRTTKTAVARLVNLKREMEDLGAVDIDSYNTVTVTIVWTKSTGEITLDFTTT